MAAERLAAFRGTKNTTASTGAKKPCHPTLWSRGFQKLDVVALTHAHQDHLGGLTAILENFQVARLWVGREVSIPALARLEEIPRERKISVEPELRGKSFR